MLALSHEQRALLAETVRDIANIAAGAMVFGQFLGAQMFSLWTAVSGATLWIALVSWALALAHEAKR